MRKILEWCDHHKEDASLEKDEDADSHKKTTDIDEWDQRFMQVDQEMLFKIIEAAHYMDIEGLLDTCCKAVAIMFRDLTLEEIRKASNV